MIEFNLLKITSDSGRSYIFDALSNNIYEIDRNIDVDSISPIDIGNESDIRDPLVIGDINKIVNSNAKTLIIELTESCNIRCTYCVFDDADKTERNHSEKSIPEEVALQSIEDFFKRTNGEEAYLVFYGGEPLINFPLIRKIVEKSNLISNKKIKFSFTTNGISLTSEKFLFLIENDFKITISVDGPDFIHDKRRVTKNGKGTFYLIEKNLTILKDFNVDFFRENIDFNCVISDFNDIDCVNRFFESSELFRVDSVRFSSVISNSVDINSKISSSISMDDLKSSLIKREPVLFSTENSSLNKFGAVQNSFIGDIVNKIKHRYIDDKAKNGKKICIPFSNRTYVRVTGHIQFCERIQQYGVADRTNDISYLSMKAYEEFYAFKADACSKCFAYNFCEMCPASFISSGVFSDDLSVQKCSEYRNNVKRAMVAYINSMEIQP